MPPITDTAYPADAVTPKVTNILYAGGNAKLSGNSVRDVALVSDIVDAAKETSSKRILLAAVFVAEPLFIHILATVAAFVPKGLNLIL